MTLLQALFLGILQGLTEFLPISSSGHLVLAELLLNIHIAPQDMQGLNTLLHAGTLLALLIIYSETWIAFAKAPFNNDKHHTTKLVLLVIATIPGAITGFLLEDWIANHFQILICVGLAFGVTGLILLLGECCPSNKQSVWHRLLHPTESEPRKLTTRSSFFIGFAQALALIPGLSRSGLTISAGRMMGLERKDALDFSFLMAVPIIAGASVLAVLDLLTGELKLPSLQITTVAVATSFISSFVAIIFLRKFVVSRSLAWFTPYLFVVSAITIFLSLQ
ncbi:MAG: undecaprenyl-diphosphate phosphatase [Candidatus Peribacteraceae bacterium]|jgi:undecaprenyl-diphosphatase|nr:undecaprenyl-diphosphate phosphatase [Candidatus Peribacteraceae bacterium]|tara:strand:- start:10074 stop:10907 length:834 start_codon:yes stop_codon:yes gene_type:complete